MKKLFSLLCLAALLLPGRAQVPFPQGFQSIPDGPTFYWTVTTTNAEINFAGPSSVAIFNFGANISTNQFHSPPSSLNITSNTFSLVEWYNDSNNNVWTRTPSTMTMQGWFYWEGDDGWPAGNIMLGQVTGKSNVPAQDTDDAVQVYMRGGVANNIRMQYFWNNAATNRIVTLNYTSGLQSNKWYQYTASIQTNASPYMKLVITDGTTAVTNTSTSFTGSPSCLAWHLNLNGNDLSTSRNFYLDDLYIWNKFIP